MTRDEARELWDALDGEKRRILRTAVKNGSYLASRTKFLIPLSYLEAVGLMCWVDHRLYCASPKGEALIETLFG